jgi:3-oxoacyl-[acyl-carrier-protein] synthase-3
MKYTRITGTGSYLPEKVLTNADLEKMVDTSDAWIVERTGIQSRHIMADYESTSSMAEMAARNAIEAAGIGVNDIELIIVATATPDLMFPSTACVLQHRLGIKSNIPAFDISAACSGFIYGLNIVDQYIRNGSVKHALVIGAEALSRIVDWTDRTTCVLFADGAGACVASQDESPGILCTHIHANGQYKDLLYTANQIGQLSDDSRYVQMKGNEVFKIAVNTLSQMLDEALKSTGLDKSAIDWLIPHQANLRIIQAMAKKLDMSMDRVVVTVESQGNTSAASIPLALDVAVRDGRIKRGEVLLLEAFGAGFTWGSSLIKY